MDILANYLYLVTLYISACYAYLCLLCVSLLVMRISACYAYLCLL